VNRVELENHIDEAIELGRPYVFLGMGGDPNARRQRLLGHHKGPYGLVVGWNGNCNIVMFGSHALGEYLDSLPTDVFGVETDLALEINKEKR
jgi:hypothetical protein